MKYTVKKGIINDNLTVNGEVIHFSKGIREVSTRFQHDKHILTIQDRKPFLDEQEIGTVFYEDSRSLLQRYKAIRAEFELEETKWKLVQNNDRSFQIWREETKAGSISRLTKRRIEIDAEAIKEASFLYAIALLMFHEDDLDIV